MPPTFAAAMIAVSGFSFLKNSSTAACDVRSSSWCVRTSSVTSGSRAKRRTSAEPTIPWCPAIKSFMIRSWNTEDTEEAPRSQSSEKDLFDSFLRDLGELSVPSVSQSSCERRSRGIGQLRDLRLSLGQLKVMRDHDLDQLLEAYLGLPAELLAGFRRVADQQVHLRRTLVALVVLDVFFPVETQQAEGLLAKFLHAVRLVRRDHVISGRFLLQHQPHHLDIFLRITPVAPGVEVTEVNRVLQAQLDARGGAGDLAGDEGLAAARALVVEQNPARGVKIVALAVVHRQPVGVDLGAAIGRARPEGRRLGLRHLLHLAKHLGGRCLIVAAFLHQAGLADGLEDALCPEAVDVAG